MNIVKWAKMSLILTALCGCSLADHDGLEWRPYKDIDGQVKKMAFVRRVSSSDAQRAKTLDQPQGEAIRQSLGGRERLGDLYYLFDTEKNAVAAIFRAQGKSLSPYVAQDVKQMAESRTVDFYEFGKFRLAHARFEGKNALCRDFKSKTGVDLLMTANYYPRNSFTDFYTGLINVNLRHDEAPKEIGYTPSFTGSDADLQGELKADEAKRGKNIALLNIQEKASILFNIICK